MTKRIMLLATSLLVFPSSLQAQDASRAASDTAIYLERIDALDDAGPILNAVIVFNPDASNSAKIAEQAGLPLAGRTILVKDNIETREWPTTAGSLALKDNLTGRDAPLIANLRAAGGVVLGKTNLSEWANIRGDKSTSGWSAIGGQTKNPHAIDRNPCGSSSGSGAAVAARLAWAAIGTETDGSITCPASVNGIVGFKPTVGMVSRTYVVPISHSQDTAGPMAQSVRDAAMLLTAIAGSDPLDPATAEADQHKTDFTVGLDDYSLSGVRIGVLRSRVGDMPKLTAVFETALDDLRNAGAEIVDVEITLNQTMWADEYKVLLFELREDLNAYLANSPADIPVRSLAEVIAFNKEYADEELRWFGQEIFELAEQTTERETYDDARANSLYMAGADGIDRLLKENNVSFLVVPTESPAWPIDLIGGDSFNSTIGAGSLAAIAGYPHLTVPMGEVEGLPVGLSIMGPKWSDHAVLKVGAAYEGGRSVDLHGPAMTAWDPD